MPTLAPQTSWTKSHWPKANGPTTRWPLAFVAALAVLIAAAAALTAQPHRNHADVIRIAP